MKQFEEILTAKPGVGKQFEDSSSNLFSLFFMCLWIYILPQADVYNEFFKLKTWLEGYLLTLFKHCPGMLLFSQFWQYRLEGDGLFPSNAQAIWYQVCPMGSVLFLRLCLEAYHLFVFFFCCGFFFLLNSMVENHVCNYSTSKSAFCNATISCIFRFKYWKRWTAKTPFLHTYSQNSPLSATLMITPNLTHKFYVFGCCYYYVFSFKYFWLGMCD